MVAKCHSLELACKIARTDVRLHSFGVRRVENRKIIAQDTKRPENVRTFKKEFK
jgi:hypothetical protein